MKFLNVIIEKIKYFLSLPKLVQELEDDIEFMGKEIMEDEEIIVELQYELNTAISIQNDLEGQIEEIRPSGVVGLELIKDGVSSLKWVSKDLLLSKNFKVSEFMQKDGLNYLKIDMGMINILQKVRNKFKKVVTVTSGYRSPSYNKDVGGVPTSKHILGRAADFKVSGINKNDVLAYVKSLPEVKYAYTNSTNMKYSVHINV